METLFFDQPGKLRKNKTLLEKKLNVIITLTGKRVSIEGNPIDEYEGALVLDAFGFGYSLGTALLLKEEDIIFRKISIKDFTRRKDLEVVKGRIIGTRGRTKETIENIADCKVVIKDNEVGIIGAADEIEYALTGIANLIRGSKQSNVYKFLERINTKRKIK